MDDKKLDLKLHINKINPKFKGYWKQINGKIDGVCKEYVLSTLLVSVGAAIGNKISEKGRVVPNLFCVLIDGKKLETREANMSLGLMPIKLLAEKKNEEFKKVWGEYKALSNQEKWRKFGLGYPIDKLPSNQSPLYPVGANTQAMTQILAGKPDGLFAFPNLKDFVKYLHRKTDLAYWIAPSFFDGLAHESASYGDVEVFRRQKWGIERKTFRPSFITCSDFDWFKHEYKTWGRMRHLTDWAFFINAGSGYRKPILTPSQIEVPEEWKQIFEGLDELFPMTVSPSEEAKKFLAQNKEEIALLSNFLRCEVLEKIAIINHCLDMASEDFEGEKPDQIQSKSYQEALEWVRFFGDNRQNLIHEVSSQV